MRPNAGAQIRPGSSAIAVVSCVTLAAVLACHERSTDRDDQPTGDTSSVPDAPVQPTTDAGGSAAAPSGSGSMRWSFDSTSADEPPPGFSLARTGSGRAGRWVVRAVADAPSSPNVLAQEDSDRTDYRFPVAVANAPMFSDVSVSVRCKPVSGRVDQACGIVWRYQDENNYYLTRANALEDNVCWYYVQNGRRTEVKRVKVKVASGTWHTLRADMRGDHIEVYFNDTKLIDMHDSRFTKPGKIGVWTKADSHTLFDDLTATSVTP